MYPLIYIHKGYSWYVPLAVRNGKRFSDEVIYIGDSYGCTVASLCGAKASEVSLYFEQADRFAKIYRHHSEMGADFELLCIQRWFILAEYMEASGLNQGIYLDTDVLLAKRINCEIQQTLGYGLTYTGYSAHTCIINRLDVLRQFCQWIISLYTNPESETRMIKFHRHMVARWGGGGVSDMTLFHWFQKDHPLSLGDYPAIFGESPFDVSLEETNGFMADEEGFKRLIWRNGVPSAITDNGRLIALASLHHQGRGKKRLSANASMLGTWDTIQHLLGKLADLFYRCCKRLFSEFR